MESKKNDYRGPSEEKLNAVGELLWNIRWIAKIPRCRRLL